MARPKEVPVVEQEESPKPALSPEAAKAAALAKAVAESRQSLKTPLTAGQKFFESPEGFIVIGDASVPQIRCRQANSGKGMWIQPMR